MTNKEYIIQNHLDDIIESLTELGSCALCGEIGCTDYCNSPKAPHSCEETFKSWLEQEHMEELLYPIGTIVEVKTVNNKILLGYYNGTDNNGFHYVCSYKENIGKTDCLIPINTVKIRSSDVTKLIKKVGD